MPLTAEQVREASARIAAWRLDPTKPVACPVCDRLGLDVIDRSARPHAEWYTLSCSACGLSDTLHLPLGHSTPTLD